MPRASNRGKLDLIAEVYKKYQQLGVLEEKPVPLSPHEEPAPAA